MSLDKLKGNALLKMLKPVYGTIIEPVLKKIIKSKDNVKLQGNESEVGILFFIRDEKIMICAPVFDQDSKITRFVPLSEDSEAVNFTQLIESTIKPNKNAESDD